MVRPAKAAAAAPAKRSLLARAIRRFGVGRVLGLTLLSAILAIRIWDPAPIETLRLRTFDYYQVLHPRDSTAQPVVIVDIDDESLSKLGQWPWPRTLVAELVTKLRDAPVVALGFDIVFAEPDRTSPERIAQSLTSLTDDVRKELAQLPSNDWIFAQVLKGTPAVLGQSGHPREVGDLERPVRAAPLATLGGNPKPYLPRFPGIVRNIEILEDAARGHGAITVLPEDDGIVRRIPGATVVRGTVVPNLVLDMLRVATGQDAFAIKVDEAGVYSFIVGGVELPTDRYGRIWVNYARPNPKRYVSAQAVLSGEVPREQLANKLVLIGTSATGLFDVKTTPLNPAMPGVEVHAQLLETILAKSYLLRPNYALGAELIMTALVGLLVIVIIPVLGAVFTILLGAGVASALVGLSWYLFVDRLVLLDVAGPLIASLTIYLPMVFVNYFREEAQRRQVRGAFSQYLSPELVDQLASNPEQLVLGGQTKKMTVLFCDAQGFTSISEQYKTDPQGLTRLMNRLLTPLTNVIVERRGTIDKYMGDAIMAFWNAPLDDADHARHACDAALVMIAALERLNEERAREAAEANIAFLPLRVGVGLNTGDCVVGNFGSDLRFDYSVMGDSVNLASRLEGQTRTYGVDIVIGSSTATAVADSFALIELDCIRVKGKKDAETIHAVLGDAAVAREPGFQVFAARADAMLKAYRAQRWDEALDAIAVCRALDLELGLGKFHDLYEERVRAFQTAPPPPDWDGVYVATTK